MELLLPYIKAFIVGGAICTIGQVLINYTKLTPARILVIFVVAGVVLGALGIYQPLIDFAGAGATVPLTGFGANLAKGIYKAVAGQGLLGVFTGGFTASSAGLEAAVVFSLAMALIAKPKEKG